MVNTSMTHVFRHPKKYKELHGLTSRKCNTRQRAQGSLPANGALNSDQVISSRNAATAAGRRAPGPGHKPQAPSVKLSNQPVQASSDKHQAPSSKLQAPSHKQQAPRS